MPAAPAVEGRVDALLAAVPAAGAAHVVNNGAAALALVATALAAGREIVIARGELVEIGDGFRIPDLLTATGARLREVGTTNRVTPADYADAVGPDTAFILKVHPSNFVVTGFTRAVDVDERWRSLGVPVVADIGSGLLAPHPLLPDEPDATTALTRGATLVTASGDKLLGGPQAGLLLGAPGAGAELVDAAAPAPARPRAARGQADPRRAGGHPARPGHPVRAGPRRRRRPRCTPGPTRLAESLRRRGVPAEAVDAEATVGGGGAPGVTLPERRRRAAGVVRRGAAGRASPRCSAASTAAAACSTCARCPPTPDDVLAAAVLACTSSRPRGTSTTASRRWSGRSPGWSPTAGPRSAGGA